MWFFTIKRSDKIHNFKQNLGIILVAVSPHFEIVFALNYHAFQISAGVLFQYIN